MERLLVLKLAAQGCEAEALLNGVALARVGPRSPVTWLPVHEYTLAGANRLELLVGPPPAKQPPPPPAPPTPKVGDGAMNAQVLLLLPRVGHAADERSARTLAQVDWTAADGEVFEVPLSRSIEVSLPVAFPRWRWLDAPATEPTQALRIKAFEFVRRLAFDLARGEVGPFLAASRLRIEEFALAYQRAPEHEADRLRDHLLRLYASKRLQWEPLLPEAFHLRPQAAGRLLECVDAAGEPALRTVPDEDGVVLSFPLRLAVVEGKMYALR